VNVPGSSPGLSVVIVCRNQRESVLRCIRSVLACVEPREILIVDSASTDGTRSALTGLPVRWIGLAESPLLCASLGRHVGASRASGEFLLFLDGDMELIPGFLPEAFAALEAHGDAAGVTGQLFDEVPGVRGARRDVFRITAAGPAARFGGAVLFRRRSFLEAGGFDPYIFNREENELYSRIRKGGEVVYQLPIPMAIHHDPPRSPAENLLREILPRRKRPLGRAQAFLRAFRKGNLFSYIRQERLFFFSLAVDAASLAAIVFLPHPSGVRTAAALQAGSLAVHRFSWSVGQFVLNKIALVQFLAGLAVVPALLRRPLPAVSEEPR